MRPTKATAGDVRGPWVDRGEPIQLDAVGNDADRSRQACDASPSRGAGLLGDGEDGVKSPCPSACDVPVRPIGGVGPSPVESSHDGTRPEPDRCERGSGYEGLMDVHDRRRKPAQRRPSARHGRRPRRDRAREPLTEIGIPAPTLKNAAPSRAPASRPAGMPTPSAGPITATLSPRAPSARASPSTWVWTPPGTVQL